MQEVDVHQQRLARAGRILKTKLVQIGKLIRRDACLISFFSPVFVEFSNIGVERFQQRIAISKKAVEIDFRKKQREPLIVFPDDWPVALLVDSERMADDIVLITQQVCLGDLRCVLKMQVKSLVEMVQVLRRRGSQSTG